MRYDSKGAKFHHARRHRQSEGTGNASSSKALEFSMYLCGIPFKIVTD